MSVTKGLLSSSLLQGRAPPSSSPAVLRVRRVKAIAAGRVRAEVADDSHTFSMVVFVESDEGEAMPKPGDLVDVASSLNVVSNGANGKSAFIVHEWTVIKEGLNKPQTPETPQTPSTSTTSSSSTTSATPATPSKRSTSPSTSRMDATKARKTLFFSPGRPSSQLSAPRATHPIRDLNPYVNKFTILARVLSVSELRERSSSRWSGHIFDAQLEDETGIIKGVAFGENAVKFHPLLVVDKVVFLSNAQVQPVKDTRYNNTGHNYELVLNARTSVDECREKRLKPARVYSNYISLDEVVKRADKERVDVFAVIKSVERDVRQLTARASGRTLRKREVTLVDESNCQGLGMAVWDKKADEIDDKCEGKVVYVRNAAVNDFNGKSLSLSFSSVLEFVDPDENEQAQKLSQWFKSNSGVSSSLNLAKSNSFVNAPSTSLAELRLQMQANRDTSVTSYFEVDVYITSVNWSSMWYNACPDSNCRRKMVEMDNGYFRCNKCNQTMEKCDLRYVLKITIADCTDHQSVTLFDDEANIMLEKKAEEVAELKRNDYTAFEALTRKIMFQRMVLKLKCRTEMFNDEKRLKITVAHLRGVTEPQSRIEMLKKEIANLENLLT